MHSQKLKNTYIGILGLEAIGLADRSTALDILHALSLEAGFKISFHLDCAFDAIENIWETIESEEKLDILLVSLRATSGVLLPRLQQALDTRISSGLSSPLVVFGGQTALASPDIVKRSCSNSLVFTSEAEIAFPDIVSAIKHSDSLSQDSFTSFEPMQTKSQKRITTPAHFSTERAVHAGGTIWIEASRGCSLNCSFCVLSNKEVPKTWFPRNIEQLLDEIQYISESFGVNNFSFSDFSAFESETYVDELIDQVIKRKLRMSFRCDMRLGTAIRIQDRLKDLYEVGLRQVYVGIESLIPKQQQIYNKGYPGRAIIESIQSVGIGVVVGFVMLDPLVSRADFRRQVIGIKEEGLLDLISTLFKTMRLQKGTDYERIAFKHGIVKGLNPDLFSYSYQCCDPAIEIVRQVVDFFHQTTKAVYYNPYIENMLRCRGENNSVEHLNMLHTITARYRNAEYRLLDEISKAIVNHNTVNSLFPLISKSAQWFSSERKRLFEKTARDYEWLLERGLNHYRMDLEKFLEIYKDIPSFDDSIFEG